MLEELEAGRTPLLGKTGNRLYRNLGDGRFENATEPAGVRGEGGGGARVWKTSTMTGIPDLFHTNGWGHFKEFQEDPSRLFMSNGDGTFTERARGGGHRSQRPGPGRGVRGL